MAQRELEGGVVDEYPPRAKSQLNPELTFALTDPTLDVTLAPRCLSAGVVECFYEQPINTHPPPRPLDGDLDHTTINHQINAHLDHL